MNQKQAKALRRTLPLTLTSTERKSTFRRLKRDFNETPRNERAEFIDIRKRLADAFTDSLTRGTAAHKQIEQAVGKAE